MNALMSFLRSSIGLKIVMAVSGLVLWGFVVVHMLGNLQVYLDPRRLNDYGAALQSLPALLWTARGLLLAALVAHVWAAWSSSRASWKARPVAYARHGRLEAGYASRSMRWGGVTLALFVVYHVLHFTTGHAHPDFVPGDVHHNFVAGFQVWPVAVFYVAAMVALGLHLYHGVWSLLQTLGLNHPRYNPLRHALATGVAVAVVAGNVSFPVAVLAGLVR